MKKAQVIETLDKLPNEFSTEELLEKLLFIDKVERSLQEAEAGKTILLDEMKARMAAKWFSEFGTNKIYLDQELSRLRNGDGKSYSIEEAEAILENTIRKHEG